MLEVTSITAADSNMTTGDGAPIQTGYGIQKNDLEGPDNHISTMSFGDFLDMVNPLQHIPILSEAYRSITGDKINPVARIAGDVLYSGIMGIASAGIAAVASIGDEVYAANNDGKSMGSTVVAALFGKDDETNSTTQLADASTEVTASPVLASAPVATSSLQAASLDPSKEPVLTSLPASQLAFLQTPAKQSAILSVAPLIASASSPYAATTAARASFSPTQTATAQPTASQVAQAQAMAASSPISAAAANAASTTSDPVLGMALDRGKPAYGGVMDTSMMQNAMQNQTLALALANGKNKMDAAHAVRNSRFATTVPGTAAASGSIPDTTTSPDVATPPAPAPTAPTASASPPATPTDPSTALMQASEQSLMPSLRTLKGLDHYRNAAQSMPLAGSAIDVVN